MDRMPSRRTVLCSGALGAAATLAGCLGSGDDDPTGNESNDPTGNESGDPNGNESNDPTDYEFRNWVIPDNQLVPGAELVCQYFAYDRALANDVVVYEPERTAGANLVLEAGSDDDSEVDPASVEAELRVGPSRGSILFGEFDTDAIVSALMETGREEIDSRGEYRIVGIDGVGTTAVGPSEVLATAAYGDILDAAAGDGTLLEDEDPAADRLFDLLPEGYVTAVSYHSSLSDLVISGESRTEFETTENDQFLSRSVRAFVFDSESNATTDRAREIMNTGRGFEEIFTEEANGRAVTVEYAPVT